MSNGRGPGRFEAGRVLAARPAQFGSSSTRGRPLWACGLQPQLSADSGRVPLARRMDRKAIIELFARGAMGLVLGVGLAAGCADADDAAQRTDPAMPHEMTEDIGTLEEGLTTVDMVDCSICATARACCTAVNAGSYCNNFNADRCSTLDPGRQRTTKLNCLTLLRTTISAWRLAGRTPPPECRIPGE